MGGLRCAGRCARAGAAGGGERRLGAHARALRRGHLALVRGDDRRAERAAERQAGARRHAQRADVDDEHRRLHVERRRGRAARASSAAPSWSRACGARSTTLEGLERHAPSGQFYNWYDHRTGEKLTTWPPTGEPLDADPVLGRQRLAGGRPEDRRRARPGALAPGGSALRLDGLRLLLPAGRQPDAVPLRAGHGRGAVLLRHDRQREPDRRLHRRSPRARCRSGSHFGPCRSFPDIVRLELDRDAAGRLHAHATSARSVYDGSLPYNGTLRHAELGRQHVRGADAARCSCPRSAGARAAGAPTTRSPCARRSTTGWARPATATGASRRPTSPRAATRSTASTASAATRTATRRTTTAR